MTVENIISSNLCLCGCGQPTKLRRKKYNLFINGHQTRKEYNHKWNNGTRVTWSGYKTIQNPNHRRADPLGYVREHILVYEEFYKCCILKWGVIHHINENKQDNRIENLQGMTKKQHLSLHNTKDMSNRVCANCDSSETYIDKRGYVCWKRINDDYFCNICYCLLWRLFRSDV